MAKEVVAVYLVQYQLKNKSFMDQFKIELFENEYDREFVDFISLSKNECDLLKNKLYEKNKIQTSINFFEWYENKKSYLLETEIDCDIDLSAIFNKLSIKYKDKVYINWTCFDSIDIFNVYDLINYFHDIWFPSSDDIEIFDESFDWILSIRHDGVISYFLNTPVEPSLSK